MLVHNAPLIGLAAFHQALQGILQRTLAEHKRVIFNGNGYEPGWLGEAAKRGLPNAPTSLQALAALAKKENAALFERYGVFSARELASRREIFLEEFAGKVRIEGTCARDIASEMILPAVRAEYAETLSAFAQAERSMTKNAAARPQKRPTFAKKLPKKSREAREKRPDLRRSTGRMISWTSSRKDMATPESSPAPRDIRKITKN